MFSRILGSCSDRPRQGIEYALDRSASKHKPCFIIQDNGLPRGYGAFWAVKANVSLPNGAWLYRARRRPVGLPDLGQGAKAPACHPWILEAKGSCTESLGEEPLSVAQDNPVCPGIEPEHIEGLWPCRDAEAAPLTDSIEGKAFMTAEDTPLGIDKIAWLRRAIGKKRPIVSTRDKILAFRLVGGFESELACCCPDLVLGQLAKRKTRRAEKHRIEGVEEVALVLGLRPGSGKEVDTVFFYDAGVVTCGENIEVKTRGTGALEEKAELQLAIADDAGVRCPTQAVFAAEIIEDEGLILVGQVDDLVGDAKVAGEGLTGCNVLGFIGTIAALPPAFGKCDARFPDLHRDSDDLVAFPCQKGGRNGRIHPAGEPNRDTEFPVHRLKLAWLCRRGHGGAPCRKDTDLPDSLAQDKVDKNILIGDPMEQLFIGFTSLTWQMGVMYAVGAALIWLAINKEYEPMLLLPIGFGAILVNLPLSIAGIPAAGSTVTEPGFLAVLYEMGIKTELFPLLIFVAVGAMIDFGPLFKNPFMIFFGAAAQFGIFATMIVATWLGFSLKEAASIGIIGAADGPTSIFVSSIFAPGLLGPISVAAYSYMSLVPLIQPPVIRALTTAKERRIHMVYHESNSPRWLKVMFPIVVTMVSGIIAPISVPLIGSLMFGNLIRESGVLERLSQTAQNELAYLVTLLLGITIGSSMTATAFLTWKTLMIMGLGLVAFVFDTAGGVMFAKAVNLFLPKDRKVNPMIGACGISAFPMSGRIVQKMANEEEKGNIILMHAIGSNVSGQIGSVIAGGMILAFVPLFVK